MHHITQEKPKLKKKEDQTFHRNNLQIRITVVLDCFVKSPNFLFLLLYINNNLLDGKRI